LDSLSRRLRRSSTSFAIRANPLHRFHKCCSHRPVAGAPRRFFHISETAHRAVATADTVLFISGFKFLSCHYSEEQSHLGILRMQSGKIFLITVAGLVSAAVAYLGTGLRPI